MQFRQYEKQASRVNCSGHMKQDNGLNGVIFTYCILPADESERLVFGKKLRFLVTFQTPENSREFNCYIT